MEEKLENLLKDPTFLAELDAAETLEDISAVLNRYDIQVVPEDLQKTKEAMEADTELNEGDLDGVSGGLLMRHPGPIGRGTGKILRWLLELLDNRNGQRR